ncbi:MAG: exo-alpha-sialidase [Chloroflexi bacterium]|nr:MAG: exo-alpha-sialidase [Chloroflexota bacterium]
MLERTRLMFTPFAILVLLVLISTAGLAVSGRSSDRKIERTKDAAGNLDEVSASILEQAGARYAPGTSVPGSAFLAAFQQGRALPLVGGAWSELTTKMYDSDDKNYRDPVFSNGGGGNGLVTGRMSALAVQANGTLWAGAADGGVWKSTNGGNSWTPKFDTQGSLSIGAIAINPADQSVWVGTGEDNTAFENYRGIGVLRSTDGGSTWSNVGGSELDGTTIGRLTFDGHGNVYAATSFGLWRRSTSTAASGSWTLMFDAATFGFAKIPYGFSMANDVQVRPGSNGQTIVANMSWRSGTAYDGIYQSTDGGASWGRVKTGGAINDADIGRSSLSYSADGSKLYALVESPRMINSFTQSGGNVLQGIYVSPTGDAAGPWNKIAESSKLANSGSALKSYRGYAPGVQAWYNQFIAVDPADADHVYVGLEEVFETTDGGTTWNTIGPYWNFTLPCYANGADTCPKTTHPDQHAIAFAGNTVYVGNDGGVWSRDKRNHEIVWNDLNATLRTLQYYYAGAGTVTGGDAIWGGLQDNGESLLLPGLSTMVSPFGGDGGDTLVDPNNGDRAVVEYTDLDMALTTTGGRSDGSTVAFVEMTPSCFAFTYTPSPCDPNPRFIAPFRADVKSLDHWVSGGQYVWDNQGKGWDTRCSASACDWKIAYNTGSGDSTTAIAVNGSVVYAGWCGPTGCNPLTSSTTGGGFRRGIATNISGTWTELSMSSLPLRYVNALTVDPNNAAHVYAVFGGFSRHWVPNAGVGHVFETKDGGANWTDISGNLPDAPGDDLLIVNGNLVLATDVGAFIASAATPTVWSRFGTALPNSAIYDLSLGQANGGYIIAATHGRGLWKIALP